MSRVFVFLGAVYSALSVALGAVGSHALKSRLAVEALATWEIGVRYQMYHGLGLMVVGLLMTRWPGKLLTAGGWLLAAGTLAFSGTLYELCLTGDRLFVPITPTGGTMLVLGWLCVAAAVFAHRSPAR
ncbi:hypothetical protein NNJEOMEG_01415 [Fundidesulfovibrio magnetotacticus]|uniref:DUF423 domain-containing protein n=1 Tax=Fundidesulfovibrio magnetotacticus TaxID=2730080 RepID=A0A6V8LSM7_9BACT|nr:DUF423 domain-containing protein [Fundidesulfovibrio magnetotacticus]GFK93581.1 hypothetical protein NNJEOMEG_01415 [Fundidesulfovibrio magnetotacticus]